MSQLTAWSFSRLNTWEKCAFQAKCKFIDKLKEPQGPAAERGDLIHKALEHYVSGRGETIPSLPKGVEPPKAFDKFIRLVDEVRAQNPIVEQEWAFTSSWHGTSWFGKDAWYRVKLDVGMDLADGPYTVIDWKTGKRYGSNDEQMEQYALAVFTRYADVQNVDTRLWYLDGGDEEAAMFPRKDHAKLRAKWENRTKPYFADTIFAPRPGQHCRFCHFRKSNDGPCKFG